MCSIWHSLAFLDQMPMSVSCCDITVYLQALNSFDRAKLIITATILSAFLSKQHVLYVHKYAYFLQDYVHKYAYFLQDLNVNISICHLQNQLSMLIESCIDLIYLLHMQT